MAKVLSVRQPYADWIMTGEKWCENRSWHTGHCGQLYIHASRWDGPRTSDAVTGAIIGHVELLEIVHANYLRWLQQCITDASFRDQLTPDDRPLYDLLRRKPEKSWRHVGGPLCWILTEPRRLQRPVPAKGRLRLWNADV